jgi:SAM-dependent methyltransferase
MRVHAETALKILNMPSANDMLQRLQSDPYFAVYETAAYNIFRNAKLRRLPNYVISEYFQTAPFGTFVKGVRNENLECLTFSDNRFDLLINSDVLEHVNDLDKALSEIKRVLKPGGYHVFTIPVDEELQTSQTRARVVNGRLEHVLEPVMHGDSIRNGGILAFKDFGRDVLDYISRDGFACKEYRYYKNNKHVTSVYYAQKQ